MDGRIRVSGPTADGRFFLHDTRNRVWDGEAWRGFGEAEKYPDFQSAFKARHAAKAALSGETRERSEGGGMNMTLEQLEWEERALLAEIATLEKRLAEIRAQYRAQLDELSARRERAQSGAEV